MLLLKDDKNLEIRKKPRRRSSYSNTEKSFFKTKRVFQDDVHDRFIPEHVDESELLPVNSIFKGSALQ